jgi:hypothetical protein
MFCDDPLVLAFRRIGYNVVRFPSLSYRPLLLLESDGRRAARSVGPLETELASTGPPPSISTAQPAPDIEIQTTRKLSGKLALDVLRPLLAAIGANATASASVTETSAASVSLQAVTRDSVAPGDLARYLEGDVRARSSHVEDAAASGRLYVVTGVLRSAALSLRLDAAVARQAQVSVSPGDALQVTVGPEDSTDRSCELTFVGPQALAFAFQAVKLVYEHGIYMDFETAHGLSGFELRSAGDGPPEGALMMDDGLVELD